MKSKIAAASLLVLCLPAVPALAQDDIYDNGPTNGQSWAWEFNLGQVTSDTFVVGGGGASIDGFSFFAWLVPWAGEISAEVSITSSEFGGTTYFDENLNFTSSNCFMNQDDWQVCTETVSFSPVNLNSGTYWLNLQNGLYGGDSPMFWDENDGPSRASQNSVGTIPSESFTLYGTAGGTTSTTGTTPEPGSFVLFGSGVMAAAGILRRKIV